MLNKAGISEMANNHEKDYLYRQGVRESHTI